jgi:hypothetical protein
MKKGIVAVVVLLSSIQSQAQWAVKLTPITVFRNMLCTVHGEYAFADHFSFSVGLSKNLLPKSVSLDTSMFLVTAPSSMTDTLTYSTNYDQSHAGFSIDPEFRYYFKEKYQGAFVGLYSSQRFSDAQIDEVNFWSYAPTGNYEKMNTHVGVYGFEFGYDWLFNEHWIVDLYTGFGYKVTTRNFENHDAYMNMQDYSRSSIALRGNISIGYKF